MLKGLLTKVLGDPNVKELKRLQPIVEQINALEPRFEKMSDEELRALTASFKEKIATATAELKANLAELENELDRETDFYEKERLRAEVRRLEGEIMAVEREVMYEILPEAFAAVREASKRTIGLRHYDVQLVGGVVLHEGKVAEMKTGEGKTLVATLPMYLNALTGRGCHVVTVNDYLAKRDTQWMGPIYHLLGLSVGVIQSAAANPDLGSFLFDPDFPATDDRYQYLRPVPRKAAYAADITYGTNNEFGFDYLRDNMVYDLSQCVQRELYYAIVDEVDNILIDEARTPLIISGEAEESSELYRKCSEIVRHLRPSSPGSVEEGEPDGDYVVDEKAHIVTRTEQGDRKIEAALGIKHEAGESLYDPERASILPYIDNALRAHVLYKRDRDYILKDGEVIIVDEFTGRLMFGRRYSEGLHQAIEAKEGVQVRRETLTLATITFQNFFRMYKKLAGMTGTAATEAEEFNKIYGLDVVVIPTNIEYRAMQGELITERDKENGAEVVTYYNPQNPAEKYYRRVDYLDVVYRTQKAKFKAVVEEIEELHRQGRPVLVGTTAVETSEFLSELLRRRGIPHQVLNAKYHEKEAVIIAQAGRPGAVTIATNMAGRGVDILLGGNPEGLAREELRRQGVDLTAISEEGWAEALSRAREICRRDREKVLSLGGLHILGTERHEARRIDNQLRGRAGRQGDPGSSRFYLSLEDDLMRRFGGASVAGLMEKFGVEDDIPLEYNLISKAIENAQVRVEGYNFDIRKHVLEYDDVVNKQREVIYAQRRQALRESSLKPTILRMVGEEVKGLLATYLAGHREDWDMAGFHSAVHAFMPFLPALRELGWEEMEPEEIEEDLSLRAERAYDELELAAGRKVFREAQKTGQRLEELAKIDGLYNLIYQSLPRYLDEKTWAEVQENPLAAVDRDMGPKVERAFGQILTLHRDRHIVLRVVDNLWIRHLTDLDNLREGIGLRAYGQQDPLLAYKKEAHEMYGELVETIRHDIVAQAFLPFEVRLTPARQVREVRTNLATGLAQPVKRTFQKVGRNDPCPCGSGKKYKHCHMRQDLAEGRVAMAEGMAPPQQNSVPLRGTATSKLKKKRKRRR